MPSGVFALVSTRTWAPIVAIARRPMPFSPSIGRTSILGSRGGICAGSNLLSVPMVSHRLTKSSRVIPMPSSRRTKSPSER